MKKLLAFVAVVALLVGIKPALAAPYDWVNNCRNSDDSDYTPTGIPSFPGNNYGFVGTRYGGGCAGSWYALAPYFTVSPGGSTYGSNNYILGLDISGFNWQDIGSLSDTMDGKVSTSTYNSAMASVTSSLNTINNLNSQISSNLYGTSTNMSVGSASTTSAGLMTKADKLKLDLMSTSTQVQTDWTEVSTSSLAYVKNKPSFSTVATSGSYSDLSNKPVLGTAYEGTTTRVNAFPLFKSATVGATTAVFNLTTDGTSGGTAIFPNGVIQDSVQLIVSDATASYQMSYAFSNVNKTLTVTANKLTTANILTGVLGQASAAGAVVKLTVYGY